MKWGLIISNRARRATRDIPREAAEQIDAAFQEMRVDPYGGDVKFLKGTNRVLRRRVGAWRIMYEVLTDQQLIVIEDVERRGSHTY